jgi:hypothetical protein
VQNVQFRVHRSLLQRHSSFLASAEVRSSNSAQIPITNGAHNVVSYVCCGVDRGFSSRDVEALLEHMYHDLYVAELPVGLVLGGAFQLLTHITLNTRFSFFPKSVVVKLVLSAYCSRATLVKSPAI